MQINFEKILIFDMKHAAVQCKNVAANKIILKFKVMNVLTIRTITSIVRDNSLSVDVMTIRCCDEWFSLIIKCFTATTKIQIYQHLTLFVLPESLDK